MLESCILLKILPLKEAQDMPSHFMKVGGPSEGPPTFIKCIYIHFMKFSRALETVFGGGPLGHFPSQETRHNIQYRNQNYTTQLMYSNFWDFWDIRQLHNTSTLVVYLQLAHNEKLDWWKIYRIIQVKSRIILKINRERER